MNNSPGPAPADVEILLRHAGLIREAFSNSSFDVEAAVAAGDIILAQQPLRGYRPIISAILAGNTVLVLARDFLWRRFLEYAETLAFLERLAAAPGTGFQNVLDGIRAQSASELTSGRKAAGMNPKVIAGRKMIPRPYMGELIYMDARLSLQFHHLMVQQTLREALGTGCDAVLDIGSGMGDILAELAAGTPRRDVTYYGAEISLHGQRCLETFAKLLGSPDLRAIDFDMFKPDFGFLGGHRKLLVVSHASLVYVDKFPANFWEGLFQATPNLQFVLFEPISFCLPNPERKPLFKKSRADDHGYTSALYHEIERLRAENLVMLQELTPDFSGPTPYMPLTLIRFASNGN